ncbi:MAG TPA: hypothetical protein VEX43_10775, partial [Chthoniobacterales bacterium]|nr:hypothetical protein [Chthoniobacterales bacterium]
MATFSAGDICKVLSGAGVTAPTGTIDVAANIVAAAASVLMSFMRDSPFTPSVSKRPSDVRVPRNDVGIVTLGSFGSSALFE